MNTPIDVTRPPFDPVPVLESERLLLRGIEPADAAAIVEVTGRSDTSCEPCIGGGGS